MQSCDSVKKGPTRPLVINGLGTSQDGDLGTPAKTVHIQLLHTIIPENLGEVQDARKDSSE